MMRRDDLELSHGATAKVRENAVKQDRVRVTNAIGHHPERLGFLRRTEFIGGTTPGNDLVVREGVTHPAKPVKAPLFSFERSELSSLHRHVSNLQIL